MQDEIFERSVEIGAEKANLISEIVGSWWKEISQESQTKASEGKLYAMGKYVVALVKNSLSDGKSNGKVSAIFDHEKITVVIEDFGNEERAINLNVGGDFGMKETIEYADDFVVEAGGKMYEKANTHEMLEEVDDSDVRTGSKVIFIKYIGMPPAPEAEVSFRGRNFSERM